MRRIYTNALFIIATTALLGAGCNGQLVVGNDTGPWVSCTNDRSVKLVVDPRDWSGMQQVTSDGVDGYYLYGNVLLKSSRMTRVDATGNQGETLTVSELGPQITDVAPNSDGGALLTGYVDSVAGDAPWIGKVDARWELASEGTLGMPTHEVAVLPDGGAVVTGVLGDPVNAPTGIAWARLDQAGNIVWERSLALTGLHSQGWWGKRLSLGPNGIRIVAPTNQGIKLIESKLDGTFTQLVIASPLAVDVSDSAALPDGRLALASSRASGVVLTMVAADGSVEWEELLGEGAAEAVAYNGARNELLIGGSGGGDDARGARTWMVATDLDGNQTWELVREPIDTNIDGYVTGGENRGPAITDIAVQRDGSFIATGQTTNLSYFLVSAGGCK